MIKGKAKIELTNVKTGEKETYESKNMITNYLKDCLTPNYNWIEPFRYLWNSNKAYIGFSDLINYFFQGIALWDTTLEEDPDKYYFPNHAECIGRGDNAVRDTAESTAGSFNNRESITTLDSRNMFKYVWDFGTSQAVGTFSALSLLPPSSARLLPVPSDTLTVCTREPYYLSNSRWEPNNTSFLYSYNSLINIVNNQNYFYFNQQLKINSNGDIYYANINLSQNQINIYKFSPPLNILDVRDGFGCQTKKTYFDKYTKTYNLSLPLELQNKLPESYSYSYQFNDKQLIILINPSTYRYLSSNENLNILTLDLDSLSNPNFQYTEISNFVDEDYYFYNSADTSKTTINSSTHCSQWVLTNNFIAYVTFKPQSSFSSSDLLFNNKLSDINIKLFNLNSKIITDVTFYNDNKFNLNNYNNYGGGRYVTWYGFNSFFTFNDNIYFYNFLYGESNNNYYIPCNKAKIYYIVNSNNKKEQVYSLLVGETSCAYIAPNNYFYLTADNDQGYYFPCAISTINNLETPITKSNDQEMKITYTLTVD